MSTDEMIRALVDRQAVADAITRLFVATDRKDWATVEALFAEVVRFEMAGTRGAEAGDKRGAEIAAGWAQALGHVPVVHHHMSNLLVTLDGDAADARCYATAYHYEAEGEGEKPLTTFCGDYDFHLVRDGAGWRIDLFRYDAKFIR